MPSDVIPNRRDSPSTASRRAFLKGAAALAMTSPMARAEESRASFARSGQVSPDAAVAVASASPARAQRRTDPPATGATLAYVGSYSSPEGPEGSKGNGEGIYLFEMDASTGALRQREVFRNGMNPSWIAFNPARTHLYSANETHEYNGTASGSISAYAIERSTGRLRLLNTVSSEGTGPAHMSIHPSGKYALVANYAGGTIAVIAIGPSGELGAATYVSP